MCKGVHVRMLALLQLAGFTFLYKRELKHEDLYATPEEARSQYLLEHVRSLGFFMLFAVMIVYNHGQ